MSTGSPSDYASTVQRLIAEGKFQDEQTVIAEGIRLAVAREQLRADIQAGIDELDRGEGIDGKEVFAEAQRRIKAARKYQSTSGEFGFN